MAGKTPVGPPAVEWLVQLRSDMSAAGRVLVLEDESTWCQAIAKYQQVVEKAVKCLAALLNIDVGYRHEVDVLLKTIRRKVAGEKWRLAHGEVNPFVLRYMNQINRLCSLAAARPGLFVIHRRNTKYPFEVLPEEWRAPAHAGVFSREELTEFRQLAVEVSHKVEKLFNTLKRMRGTP